MPDLNKQIEKWVGKLHSTKAETRTEACEFLRIFPSLPPEAMAALEIATRDPDAAVAEAAQRALDLHSKPETMPPPDGGKMETKTEGKSPWVAYTSIICAAVATVPYILMMSPLDEIGWAVLVGSCATKIIFVLLGITSIVTGIIGLLFGFKARNWKMILASIVAIPLGLWAAFYNFIIGLT